MGSQRVRHDWATKQQQRHKGKEKDKYKNNAMLCSSNCHWVDAAIQNLMFETEKKISPVFLEWESLNHGRVNLLNTYEWIFWRNYSLNLPGALKL